MMTSSQSYSGFDSASDKGSRLWFKEDARLSTDGPVRPRRPTVKVSERVIEEGTSAYSLRLTLSSKHPFNLNTWDNSSMVQVVLTTLLSEF